MIRRRRSGRTGRIVAITVVALVLLTAGAGAVAAFSFDPDRLKPRIVAAVKQATGRDLALNGPIGLAWSLWPTLAVQDVALANPPGFSRPLMATLQRLELRIALLPLLHGEVAIDRLVLVQPDIRLETDAGGRPNWQFTPESHPATTPAASPASSGAPPGASPAAESTRESTAPTRIVVRAVSVSDGTVAYHDGRTGHDVAVAVDRFTAHAPQPDAPLQLDGAFGANGMTFTVVGDVGPIERLQDTAANALPWPVKLTLAAGGGTLAIDGSVAQPAPGRGYDLTLDGAIPDLGALAPLFPNAKLPALRAVTLRSHVTDSGGRRVPTINSLTLHAGAGDLGKLVGGLQLAALDVTAPASDQAIHAALRGSRDNTPIAVSATLGTLDALLASATLPVTTVPVTTLPGTSTTLPAANVPTATLAAPFPVDATAEAAGGSFAAKGTIADPVRLTGVNLALQGHVPDLAALSPLVHAALPALRQVTFQGRLIEAPGGFAGGATLQDIVLTSAQGDVAGDASVMLGRPLTLRANLRSDHIDADALLAATGKPVPAGPPTSPPAPSNPSATNAPVAGAPVTSPPLASAPVASAPVAGTPASPARPARAGRLFPDTPIPFALLQLANADVTLSIGSLKTDGAEYRAIGGHAVIQDGKLRLDPFSAELPSGHFGATLSADATQPDPPVALTLQAPGFALAPLLAALDLPHVATGSLEAYADLHGAGGSPHAIAAVADGWLGVAVAGGQIDNRALGTLLGPALAKTGLLEALGHGGTSQLRCFALRLDARQGVSDVRALALGSSLLTLDGTGSVNLGDETVSLRLRPQGRAGGTGFIVPLRVSGPLRAPAVSIDSSAVAGANAATIANAVLGNNKDLAALAGALGGTLGGTSGGNRTAGGDVCPAALALARGGTAVAPPSQPDAAPAAAKPKPPNPAELLHQFIR